MCIGDSLCMYHMYVCSMLFVLKLQILYVYKTKVLQDNEVSLILK